jgi:hypothetical protein
MDRSAEVSIGMAVLALTALAAGAVYRWRMRDRVRRVETWVKGYLSDRYGGLPDRLTINCSDDRTWPVLVGFDNLGTGTWHRLQFGCWGQPSTFSLLAEAEDQRSKSP